MTLASVPAPLATSAASDAPLHVQWPTALAAPGLAAVVALFIVAVDNGAFWEAAWQATFDDDHRFAILSSLFAILFLSLTLLLSFAIGRRVLKAVAVLLLLVAANCGYFMSEYGIVIDESMIRNAVQTTALETGPLLAPAYFWHLALYGFLPSIVVLSAPLYPVSWRADALSRFATVAISGGTLIATLHVNYAASVFFGHTNHSLRLLINPTYPLYAAASFGVAAKENGPSQHALLDVRRRPTGDGGQKPALVVFVMGETARADRFSMNAYARDTNRYTRARGVVNFPRVRSCGTSTAESLPCLFSALGQARFTYAAAAGQESVFAALQRLGVVTFWRDNSTGCKGVCDERHRVRHGDDLRVRPRRVARRERALSARLPLLDRAPRAERGAHDAVGVDRLLRSTRALGAGMFAPLRPGANLTRDAIFHTLLPLFGIESPLYDARLDLFAGCRNETPASPVSR